MSIKKLVGFFSSSSSNETKEEVSKRQNSWIKSQEREWQLAWNALFDQDPGQATADNAAKGKDIPNEIDRDHRLIFGFCEVTVDTRKACFALLPKGRKLAERFEQFYNSRNASISQDEAMVLVKSLSNAIKDCDVSFEANWDNIVVVDNNDRTALHALELEGGVYETFGSLMVDPYPEKKLPEIAASFFISEICYAAAGNWYQPGRWIEGVYLEPAEDRCVGLVYKLWLGGWDVQVGHKGIALIRIETR